MTAQRRRAARRRILRRGRAITMQHRHLEDESSRGQHWTDGEAETVKAYPEYGTSSPALEGLFGADLDSSMTFHVLEDQVSESLSDGGGDGATRIQFDGREHIVDRVEELDHGTVAIICETPGETG